MMTLGKKEIPIDNFNIILDPPQNRLSSASVNIYDNGQFNMNGKLSNVLGGKALQIRITDDCRNMCILEPDDMSNLIILLQLGSSVVA